MLLSALISAFALLGPQPPTPEQVAQASLTALSNQDGTAMSELFVPGAHITATLLDGPRQGAIRTTSVADFASFLDATDDDLFEAMTVESRFETDGLAFIAGPFTFRLNGELTHCGVNSYTLLNTKEGWKISHISYTQTSVCDEAGYPMKDLPE